MTNQEIEAKVREILSKKYGTPQDQIKSDTRLAEDLGVDSFGSVELMFELEEAFNLKIPDAEIEHVKVVNDIVVYLSHFLEKQAKGQP